jgi:hypothetical protein
MSNRRANRVVINAKGSCPTQDSSTFSQLAVRRNGQSRYCAGSRIGLKSITSNRARAGARNRKMTKDVVNSADVIQRGRSAWFADQAG